MKLMISKKKLNHLKSRDNIPLKCKGCHNIFYGKKHMVIASIKNKKLAKRNYDYCSPQCFGQSKITKIQMNCSGCGKKIFKTLSDIKRLKANRAFCTKSCAATYNNTHKKTGCRRSKLEKWIEEQLPIIYPDLGIQYNQKDKINSELDIYIPLLKLAFELNGIFHYEPIYGNDKLNQIKNNDKRKFQACLENGIELCIIDVSKMKYFKKNNAVLILNIIREVIDNKIGPGGQI